MFTHQAKFVSSKKKQSLSHLYTQEAFPFPSDHDDLTKFQKPATKDSLTFEIDQQLYDKLESIAQASKISGCFKSWYIPNNMIDSDTRAQNPEIYGGIRYYIKFNHDMSQLQEKLQKGKQYTIVFDVKWFQTEKIRGFSTRLKSVLSA